MDKLNWVEFRKGYEICEETSEIRTKPTPYLSKIHKGKTKSVIMKVYGANSCSMGYIVIRNVYTKPDVVFFELFGYYYDGAPIRVKDKEYALYKGDDLLAMGTIDEIAKIRGVKRASIVFLNNPTYQKRLANQKNKSLNAQQLICLDD